MGVFMISILNFILFLFNKGITQLPYYFIKGVNQITY